MDPFGPEMGIAVLKTIQKYFWYIYSRKWTGFQSPYNPPMDVS